MADVFLSYRNTEERRRIVSRFATILRAHGISVWWDYGLEAGESYRDQISREIAAARVVIPLWCEESIKSEWVLMEAELGRDKLLPVRLQRVAPPPKFEALHAAHLERWDGSLLDPAFDEFVQDLCRRLGINVGLPADTRAELSRLPKVSPLSAPRAPSGPGAGNSKRRGSIAIPVVAVVLAALAAIGGLADWAFVLHSATTQAVDQVSGPSTRADPDPSTPNDPLFEQQWYLRSASDGGTGIQDYRHRTGADGSGVTVGAIDTGVFRDHEDLVGAPHILQGYDFVADLAFAADGDGRDPDPSDPGDACTATSPDAKDSLHGTFNASLFAAHTNNGIGIAGAAPGADFIPIRAIGRCRGKLSDIVDAIWWAGSSGVESNGSTARELPAPPAKKIDILVLPIALRAACPVSLQRAIDTFVSGGGLVIVAAGHYGDVSTVSPAGCNNVLTVAAADRKGTPARYSGYGKAVALMAPGGDLNRDDDGDGGPDGLIGVRYSSDCVGAGPSSAGVCKYSFETGGTSSAAMLTAAAAALVWSQHRSETAAQIRDRLVAATLPRDASVCSAQCDEIPGAERVPGLPGLCRRPCGAGSLDLSRAR